IADLLVFSRSPYLGIVFKIVGVLLLLILGFGNPLLWMFALLIGLTIPFSFPSDKMTAKIRKELSNLSTQKTDEILLFILQRIKQLGYGNLAFSKRYALTKGLLDRRTELKAKWTTRLFLSLLYLFSLIGGFAGSLVAAIPNVVPLVNSSIWLGEKMTQQYNEIEQADQVLRTDPNNINAYQKRAKAAFKIGDRESALADYTQLTRLQPKNPVFLIARARVHFTNADYKRAVQDYDRVLQIKPDFMHAYRLRASAKVQMQDYKAAFQDYNKLIQSGDRRAYVERGELYLHLGNVRAALADAEQALRQSSRFPQAYELRAKVREKMGDENAALDYVKADELYTPEDLKASVEEGMEDLP
ncbi:tetratricopeptide repeat protein, partial [Pseudanabaenaceae cyanobacterium LEGE 13415]|nr:tetratricopeptide repeat protein [Pseudanabaenaceae cyanobacterium LEGE 13415]